MKRHTNCYASGNPGWLVASQNFLFYFHTFSPFGVAIMALIHASVSFLEIQSYIAKYEMPSL